MRFLKSSLTSFLPPAFAPMAIFMLVGLLSVPEQIDRRRWELAVTLVLSNLIFVLYYTWSRPYFPNNDARFLASAFFPLAMLWSWGYTICLAKTSGVIHLLCRLAPVVFFALLGVFYFNLVIP